MMGWSLSIGKVFGVGVRVHSFFLVLLVGCMMWASYLDRPVSRGVMLWVLMVFAVVVRECARAMTAAWVGLDLRGLLLLPIGGTQSYATVESNRRAATPGLERALALTGPAVNLLCGLTLAGLVLAVSPHVDLSSLRLITPLHLVRALVWTNLLLAALHLIPAWPLDGGRLLRTALKLATADSATLRRPELHRLLVRLGPALALGLTTFGLVAGNGWALMMGLTVLLAGRMEREGLALENGADLVKAGEVMLTEYSILSASATLEDAIEHARHTLQDVFPVVRGGNMVGAVARQTVLDAYTATGNGYVQGIMARLFYAAHRNEPLVTVLGRVPCAAGASSQLIPVVQEERIVGIITPQSLGRSVGLLTRRMSAGRGAGAPDVESES